MNASITARRRQAPEIVQMVRRLEDDSRLDAAADALQPLVDNLVADPRRRALLEGRWLGHAVHPFLTDLPIGAWASASLLDVLGGEESRPAARKLIGLGLVAAVPTVLTGAAEWALTSGGARRVGVVHAGANAGAFVLYGASWVARRRGRHRRGVTYALAGGGLAGVGGYLGGHLAIARGVGTRDPAFER